MADVKISQLASAGVPETSAVLPIVSGGTTKKVSLGGIAEALGVDGSVVKTVNTTSPITGGPIFTTGSIGILEATPNGTRGTMSAADKAKLDAATSSNSNSTLVQRDGSGNFAAAGITATAFTGPLTGNVNGNLTGNSTGTHTGAVVGNVTGNATGNAGSATILSVARSIGISGYVTGTAQNFDGSQNITIPTTRTSLIGFSELQSGLLFPSGTRVLFQQTAAPTGWTKVTGFNDRTLRVVDGNAGSGGSTGFSSVFTSRTPAGSVSGSVTGSVSISGAVQSHVLTAAQSGLQDHTHSMGRVYEQRRGGNNDIVYATGGGGNIEDGNTGNVVNGSRNALEGHSHGWSQTAGSFSGSMSASFSGSAMDFSVAYVDIIIAQKD